MSDNVNAPELPDFWEWRLSNNFDDPESPTGRLYVIGAFNTRTNYYEEESFFLGFNATVDEVQREFRRNTERVADRAWNNYADTADAEWRKFEWEKELTGQSSRIVA